jgi:hypothetical protein
VGDIHATGAMTDATFSRMRLWLWGVAGSWLGINVGVVLAIVIVVAKPVLPVSRAAILGAALVVPIVAGAALGIWVGKRKSASSRRA